MSFEDLLVNSCTVRRNTPGVADEYGNPTASWADHLVDKPCRLMAGSGREVKIGAEVVIADYKLFIGDVAITEQDRVIVDAGATYEVLLVASKQDSIASHHKECFLRVTR